MAPAKVGRFSIVSCPIKQSYENPCKPIKIIPAGPIRNCYNFM
jgi:hypothetical protein